MVKALKLTLETTSAVFSDFGYSLRLQCGRAPELISGKCSGEVVIPFAGHTGPHETLQLAVLSSIDGMYQTMATSTVKMNPGASTTRSVVAKLDSKTGAFDPFEVAVSYVLVERSLSDAILDVKHNICLSVEAKFCGTDVQEELVLRLLDLTDKCVGMCTVRPEDSSAVLILNSDITDSELQLSLAGENSGVSWIPMKWGAPVAWVVPLEAGGYIMVTAHLMEGKGLSILEFSNISQSGGNEMTKDVLFHITPISSRPEASVASSSDVRYSEYPPSASQLQQIVDGVKSAPVVSRSEMGRGPSSGAYLISINNSKPLRRGSSSILVTHDEIGNDYCMSLVALRIDPIDLTSSTDRAACPVVSAIGHAIVSLSSSGGKKYLKGELSLVDGVSKESGGIVSVDLNVSELVVRSAGTEMKPAEPKVEEELSDKKSENNENDANIVISEAPADDPKALKSTQELLYDKEDSNVNKEDKESEGNSPSEEAPKIENEDIAKDKTEPTISPLNDPDDQKNVGSKSNLDDFRSDGTSNHARGNVGFPVNPRHVSSSSSIIITDKGTGSNTASTGALLDALNAELQTKQRTIDRMAAETNMKQEVLFIVSFPHLFADCFTYSFYRGLKKKIVP